MNSYLELAQGMPAEIFDLKGISVVLITNITLS
jgi:hypothetical protein